MHHDTGVTSHLTQTAGLVPTIFVCINDVFLIDRGCSLFPLSQSVERKQNLQGKTHPFFK